MVAQGAGARTGVVGGLVVLERPTVSADRPTVALCPHCGRYPRMSSDRGGVSVLEAHEWRRGVACPGGGLAWAEIVRVASVGVPVTVVGP